MTPVEFKNKVLCFYCAFGDKVYSYVLKLNRGEWCEHEKKEIIVVKSLLEIFANIDSQEFTLWDGTYSNITEEEFEVLLEKIEALL